MIKKSLLSFIIIVMALSIGSCAFLTNEPDLTIVTEETTTPTTEESNNPLSQSDILSSLSEAIKAVFE